jgi:1-acyl-sn-glycerol-3-phosphate acyltransferase
VFGGLFIVPLFALIQTRCDPAHLSRTIGGMNILNACSWWCRRRRDPDAHLRFHDSRDVPGHRDLNAVVALYIFSLVPEFLMRFLAWMLIHTIHRVKTIDTDRIPDEGPAVLVCNHVSYVDAIVIGAASPRPIRFVMDHRIFKLPLLGWIFRTAKAIPIAPAKEDPWLMEKAYIDIAKALHEGDLVCIFPEGQADHHRRDERIPRRGRQDRRAQQSAGDPDGAARPVGQPAHARPGRPVRAFIHARAAFAAGAGGRHAGGAGEATPEYLQQQVLALRGDWKISERPG